MDELSIALFHPALPNQGNHGFYQNKLGAKMSV
jgi:hypothetical protein